MATPHVDPHHRSQDTRQRVLQMAVSLREDRGGGSVDYFLALLRTGSPSG